MVKQNKNQKILNSKINKENAKGGHVKVENAKDTLSQIGRRNMHKVTRSVVGPPPGQPPVPLSHKSNEQVASRESIISKASKADAMKIIQS